MLFAKDADPDTSSIWLIAVGASLLLMFVFFIVLLFRHLRAVRQLTHTERMRSLEVGFPLEAPEETKTQARFMHNAFWISFWLVSGVPSAALSSASAGMIISLRLGRPAFSKHGTWLLATAAALDTSSLLADEGTRSDRRVLSL